MRIGFFSSELCRWFRSGGGGQKRLWENNENGMVCMCVCVYIIVVNSKMFFECLGGHGHARGSFLFLSIFKKKKNH